MRIMTEPCFLDSNVLIYAALVPDRRSDAARALLVQRHTISVQVLNEFADVARRRLQRPWDEIEQALADIRTLCASVLPITMATHESALKIAARIGYQFYDALILASALEVGCTTLYSEDLPDGQRIEGRLVIRNPFR